MADRRAERDTTKSASLDDQFDQLVSDLNATKPPDTSTRRPRPSNDAGRTARRRAMHDTMTALNGPGTPEIASAGLEAIPYIAGAMGGIAGSPGGPYTAMAGAGLAGAGGRALQRLLALGLGLDTESAPSTPMGVATDIGGAGLEQAGQEFGGRMMTAGGKAAAQYMGRRALKPTPGLSKEFPDLMESFFREKVPIQSNYGGSGEIEARREASSAIERGEARGAGRMGVRISATQLADEAVRDAQAKVEAAGGTFTRQMRARVVDEVDRVVRNKLNSMIPGGVGRGPWQGFGPEEILNLRQDLDRAMTPFWQALARGEAPPAMDEMSSALSQGARRSFRAAVPTVAGQGETTRSLMGLREAMRASEARNPAMAIPVISALTAAGATGLGRGMTGTGAPRAAGEGVGAGAATFLLTEALMDPRLGSRTALMLANPMVQQGLRQSPRAATWIAQQIIHAAQGGQDTTPSMSSAEFDSLMRSLDQ